MVAVSRFQEILGHLVSVVFSYGRKFDMADYVNMAATSGSNEGRPARIDLLGGLIDVGKQCVWYADEY